MQVRIFKPSKSAMQSGRANTNKWVLEYETISQRKPNNIMGWTESGDTLNQVKIKFNSKDSAVRFSEKRGWDYIISPPHERKIIPKNYSDNFK